MVVPLTTRPGVRTVPVRRVGELVEQVVGTVEQSGPLQACCEPETQVWAPLAPAMQVWVAAHEVAPAGQQLSWCPQPSEARPQVWPCCAHVLGVQVVGGVPQVLGALAPQKSVPLQVTPPFWELQV
jgi:hypothetical protein